MKSLEAVKDNVALENDLANNELLKRDGKKSDWFYNTIHFDGWVVKRWSYRGSTHCGEKVFQK